MRAATVRLAGGLGTAAGWLRRSLVVRSIPGAAGALCVSYGFFEIWHPLGAIAIGAFLLLLDGRT